MVAAANQRALKGETYKVGDAQRASGEQRKYQAIAKIDGPATCRSHSLGSGHQVEAEIK
jgi:hypothetical protein